MRQVAGKRPEDYQTSPKWWGHDSPRVAQVSDRSFALVAFTLIVGMYVWRISLLKSLAFNPDKFWHLHSAWCVFKGMIPYRDFL